MVYGFYDIFPIDGKREPPTEEEISKDIKHILSLYQRGFCTKDEVIEVLTDMVRHAELFAYAKGMEFNKES